MNVSELPSPLGKYYVNCWCCVLISNLRYWCLLKKKKISSGFIIALGIILLLLYSSMEPDCDLTRILSSISLLESQSHWTGGWSIGCTEKIKLYHCICTYHTQPWESWKYWAWFLTGSVLLHESACPVKALSSQWLGMTRNTWGAHQVREAADVTLNARRLLLLR